ncbi:hypothetical protein F5Y13DRAFT_174387 [Hypoxylon sp. FL1857]|nr:hypothetical protein F5Y13DRAFT_174387 [Hypoxylon sp. FL1857]
MREHVSLIIILVVSLQDLPDGHANFGCIDPHSNMAASCRSRGGVNLALILSTPVTRMQPDIEARRIKLLDSRDNSTDLGACQIRSTGSA